MVSGKKRTIQRVNIPSSFLSRFSFKSLIASFVLLLVLPVLILGVINRQDLLQFAAGPDASGIPVWKTLVLIYKDTNVSYVEKGVTKQLVTSMTNDELSNAEATIKKLPGTVSDWSGGNGRIVETIVYPPHPVTQLGGSPDGYWLGYTWELTGDFNIYAPRGTYDSVIVIWKSNDNHGQSVPIMGGAWGLSLGPGWANGAGFSSIPIPQNQPFPGKYPEEIFVHEWNHQTTTYYGSKGFTMPSLDEAPKYTNWRTNKPYTAAIDGTWKDFLSDTMQGLVMDNGKKIGITQAIWRSGNPTYVSLPTPTLTPTPTLVPTATPTPIPTATPTPVPTATPTPTIVPLKSGGMLIRPATVSLTMKAGERKDAFTIQGETQAGKFYLQSLIVGGYQFYWDPPVSNRGSFEHTSETTIGVRSKVNMKPGIYKGSVNIISYKSFLRSARIPITITVTK